MSNAWTVSCRPDTADRKRGPVAPFCPGEGLNDRVWQASHLPGPTQVAGAEAVGLLIADELLATRVPGQLAP